MIKADALPAKQKSHFLLGCEDPRYASRPEFSIAFEIMTDLFRRDLYDIERQQMSHSQYVYDIVKAVDPVDLGIVLATGVGTAVTGGLAAPALVQYATGTGLAAGLGIYGGKMKYDMDMDRFNYFGTNNPGEWGFQNILVDGGLGAATAYFPTWLSTGTVVGRNVIENAVGRGPCAEILTKCLSDWTS